MSQTVLDVGQCDADHSRISQLLQQHFDVELARAHSFDEAITRTSQQAFDLVLVNRILDADGTEGLEIIRALKSSETTSSLPVMMVSNFPEAQEAALTAGAVPGFGKAALNTPETIALLRQHLS